MRPRKPNSSEPISVLIRDLLGSSLERLSAMRRRNWGPIGGIFVELVAQRTDRDAENIGCVRAIAEAVLERLQDQIPFDFGHGSPDQIAGNLFGSYRGVDSDIRAAHLIEPR